jgi:hypothetical protein
MAGIENVLHKINSKVGMIIFEFVAMQLVVIVYSRFLSGELPYDFFFCIDRNYSISIGKYELVAFSEGIKYFVISNDFSPVLVPFDI